jgi:hypothetical protein
MKDILDFLNLVRVGLVLWLLLSVSSNIYILADAIFSTKVEGVVTKAAEIEYVNSGRAVNYTPGRLAPIVNVEIRFEYEGIVRSTNKIYGIGRGGESLRQMERDVAWLVKGTQVPVYIKWRGDATAYPYPSLRVLFLFVLIPFIMLYGVHRLHMRLKQNLPSENA